MQTHTGPQEQTEAAERLLIPDLCAPYPVLVMVLLSELLVLVFVLASHGLLQFDWSLFGACSLLVQWIVLLSALLLLSLIHISEPTRPELVSRMPSSA